MIMVKFSMNAQNFNSYKNLKFRVKWDGKYVAGISKVTTLQYQLDVPTSLSS